MSYQNFLSHRIGILVSLIITFLFCGTLSLLAQFTEINTGLPSGSSVKWIDYDADGDLDLQIDCELFRNDSGSFIDSNINLSVGFWNDYNLDGYPDLLTLGDPNPALYINGLTQFYRTDLGIQLSGSLVCDYWGDTDNDGDLDYFCIVSNNNSETHNNALEIFNNQYGSFNLDVAQNYSGMISSGSMKCLDVDSDNDLDVFVTGYMDYYSPYMPTPLGHQYLGFLFQFSDDFNYGGNYQAYNVDCLNGYTTNHSWALSDCYFDWNDYDNNGLLDLAISGYHEDWNLHDWYIEENYLLNSYYYTGLYSNLQLSYLLPANSLDLPSSAPVVWGDIDNDGDIDLLCKNKIYNNANGNISSSGSAFFSHDFISIDLGDYDNDGDLDMITTDGTVRLFRNDSTMINNPPCQPVIDVVASSNLYDCVEINPVSVNDDHTPNTGLSCNIRVGSQPGLSDIIRPLSNLSSGILYKPSRGNNLALEVTPGDTIYVAAQFIDSSSKGSLFSNEVQFVAPLPQIIYPNGCETLVSGRTSYIRWGNLNTTFIRIKLSTDNGMNWLDITATALPSSPEIYYYTVPIANSTQCKMRILWAKDNSYYDDSDQVFSITSSTTEPTIAVTYPTASGINMTPGQPVNITWTSSNLSEVSIDYTTNNGITWNTIVQNRPAALSPYAWTVPDSLTSQTRIRIRKADNANYYDISDNTFTICKVTVLSPNGGELLTGDYSGVATIPITWTAPFVGTINLYYSTNNGSNWTSIGSAVGSTGTYNWTIPAFESTTCRIKASHSNTSFISDISNAVFTIRVPVKFVNANGGGFVNNNYDYTLRWKNIDIAPATQVHLEYSTDNSTWTRINTAAVPVTNLSHTFFMALGEASQVWFRMAETGTNKIIAKSSSFMTVTGKTLHVSAPAIGEGLAVDSYTTITWTADGCTNLDIFYTTNFGATWLPVATNVPAAQGYQVWLVPNTTSTQCRIKLQDTTYPYMNIESDGEFTILALTLIASFYATPTTGFSDLTVQFYDQSIGYISAWAWDFENDGITDSNLQNPTWTYRQSGFYSVKLTVWDGPTSVTMTRNNYIYVLPMIADFLASETNGFAPLTVQFTDMTPSDITQWAWDFDDDGITDSDTQNPYWTYLFPGTYTVKLNVTNGLDSDQEIKLAYVTVTLDPSLTLYVPTQYSTIQAAINASVDGDYIIISDGIYYENLLIEGKNITLASYYFIDGDSTHIANTIIDGSNAINPDQASTITILPASGRPITKPHIVGFTIRNGSGRRIIQNEGGSIIEKRVGGGIYMRQVNPIFSYNKIEDNDADDEGGGSYAFQSLPNHGGMVDPAIGVYNPGGNFFANNHADIGSDIYIEGITRRDLINLQNCSFEVMSQVDNTVSNYWVNSSAGVNYSGSNGRQAAISSDIWVATNGSDTLNDGLSPTSPFRTIDHALSMIYATEADPLTINIASGTYSPSLTGEKYPLQMVKHVSLQGAGQEETILDAEGNADYPSRVLNLDKVEGIRISDLTLMNGFVTLAKNYNGGAIGILNSQVSLNNLIVAGCSSAGNGAGLYALDSSVDADSLSFQYNSALGSGGAIHSEQCNFNLSDSSILNNSVTKNGAGLSLNGGEISISGCEISDNQATGYQSKGGGIILNGSQDALLNGNRISHNNADNGAGAYLQDNSGLHLDRNRFTNNLADYAGGGVYINTTEGFFTNNLIANNSANQRGGALYCYSSPQFINNTIASNKAGLQGGALYLNGASPSLTNCILWGNVHANPETPNQVYLYGEASDPDISYSDLQGGSLGFVTSPEASYSGVYANNLDSDPLFVEASIGAGYYFEVGQNGYSLLDESPAIDSGDPITDIQLFPFDLEANPRLDNSRVDIGAWEVVHYVGARIVANPAVLDFGRVNLSGAALLQNSCLSNTGNQPLLISELTLELPGTEFSWTFAELGTPVQPGTSVNLQISFLPQQLGAVSNILSLVNNSLNSPLLRIPLSGYGIDASTSQPGNVQLQIIGNDVHLSWNPVMSDPQGNPFTPEGYIVLYCETANATLDDFLFLTFCTGTTAIHNSVARFRDRMFYRVIAIDGMTRSSLEAMLNRYNPDIPLSWAEIRKSLKKN